MSLLGLATWPHHSPPSLQDTMAIKKQKRCRKIRPVSAFISESSSLRADGTDSVSFISASPTCSLPIPPASPSNAAVPTGGGPQDMESQLGSLGIPPGWFSGLGSSQPAASGSWEGLSELPTHGYKLRHQTQGRPRPPRTIGVMAFPGAYKCFFSYIFFFLDIFSSVGTVIALIS